MWFNIVKLDLSQLSTQIQGDTEGKNINISKPTKCLDKLLNFAAKLDWANNMEGVDIFALEKNHARQMPESVACRLVEMVDKMFSQTSDKYEVVDEQDDIIFLTTDYKFYEKPLFDKSGRLFFRIGVHTLFDDIYLIRFSTKSSVKVYKQIMRALKRDWEQS